MTVVTPKRRPATLPRPGRGAARATLPLARAVALRLLPWTLYALAFGYDEAMVVVYIRRLARMAQGRDYAQIYHGWHLPLTSAAIQAQMRHLGMWDTELTRETATLLLLAGAAWGGGRHWRDRLGVFLYTFAAWDLSYYVWLRCWTGFPASLAAQDVYFLVPIAWYGPVWFPVVIVMPALIALAVWLLLPGSRSDDERG